MRLVSGLSLVTLLRMVTSRIVSRPSSGPSARRAQFVPITEVTDLDVWFARSMDQPVVLFLHDPGCPISAAAYRQMAGLDAEIPLIDVQSGRRLSRAVEERTGVRHESPQVLVLSHSQAVWSASHFAITAQAVEAARRRI